MRADWRENHAHGAPPYEGPDEVSPERASQLDALLARIPPHLSATVRLRLSGMTQREIGEELGMHQVSVSARLRGATERLRLTATLPLCLSSDAVESLVRACGGKPREARIVALYWVQQNTLATAEMVGLNQSTVHSTLFAPTRHWRNIPELATLRECVDTIRSSRGARARRVRLVG